MFLDYIFYIIFADYRFNKSLQVFILKHSEMLKNMEQIL